MAYLRLLQVTLQHNVSCAESQGTGDKWSAIFIEPLLQLHASTQDDNVFQACRVVLHAFLAGLQLQACSSEEVSFSW
jgi:hypothetical protein